MKKIALVAAVMAALYLMSPRANAFETSLDTIGVHVGSVHSNTNQHWNNSNPGIYGVWKVEGAHEWLDGRYVAGTYYNSIYRQSYYAGRVFEWDTGFGHVGLIAGFVTGYKAAPVVPALIPSYRVDVSEHVSARVSIAPKVDKGGASAIHLSFEWRF